MRVKIKNNVRERRKSRVQIIRARQAVKENRRRGRFNGARRTLGDRSIEQERYPGIPEAHSRARKSLAKHLIRILTRNSEPISVKYRYEGCTRGRGTRRIRIDVRDWLLVRFRGITQARIRKSIDLNST